jgi:hypothetical protein
MAEKVGVYFSTHGRSFKPKILGVSLAKFNTTTATIGTKRKILLCGF